MTERKSASLRLLSSSPRDTKAIGAKMARRSQPGDVFLLIANLGAGKTTFAQGFIKALGVKEGALSPTFVLAQTYQGRVPVHHLDFYRATPAELVEAGVQDYLAGQGELPSGVVLIEWADRCRDLWPKDRVEVRIKISPQNQKRVFQIQGRGRRGETLVQGLG